MTISRKSDSSISQQPSLNPSASLAKPAQERPINAGESAQPSAPVSANAVMRGCEQSANNLADAAINVFANTLNNRMMEFFGAGVADIESSMASTINAVTGELRNTECASLPSADNATEQPTE